MNQYHYHLLQDFSLVTKSEFLLNREQLEKFAMNDIGFYRLDLTKFSTFFLFQIFYYSFVRLYASYNILDEVKFLENINKTTNTKKESQFKYEPLKGYWKKHFFTPRDMVKNIRIYWGIDKCEKIKSTTKLDRELQTFCNNHSSSDIKDISNKLSHLVIDKPLNKRKFTGNWIIYTKENNKNTYITIANHNESDYDIFSKIEFAKQFKEITVRMNENNETQ